jgi:ATP-dependent RNA helicase SUPV3L1/SUV3
MTSLTGCSGEAFSSILRSLGFESTVIKRSELPAAQAAVAAPPSESVPATPASEEPSQPETAPAENESTHESFADLTVAPQTEDETPPPAMVHSSDETESVADVQDAQPPSSAEPKSVSATVASDDGPTAAASEETIILWRPIRRGRSPRVPHPHGQRAMTGSSEPQASSARPAAESVGSEAAVPPRVPKPEKRRRWQPPAVDQEKGVRSSPGPARSEGPRSDENRRQSPGNRGVSRPKNGPTVQPAAVAVDPNSPFAKLLELRTLLESQAKNRR